MPQDDIETQVRKMVEAGNRLRQSNEELLAAAKRVAISWGDPIPLTIEECLEYSRRIKRELNR